MVLDFKKTNGKEEWVAEFEAPNHFNLHLEREANGSLVVSQRGSEQGEYALSFMRGMNEGKKVFDYDFGALVYPKHIKVTSGSKVLSAEVTFAE